MDTGVPQGVTFVHETVPFDLDPVGHLTSDHKISREKMWRAYSAQHELAHKLSLDGVAYAQDSTV